MRISIRRIMFSSRACLIATVIAGQVFLLAGCLDNSRIKYHPDTARRELILRGHLFKEDVFVARAAEADMMAVRLFLAAGMSPNVQDRHSGETPLMAAASRGHARIARVLLEKGADAGVTDKTSRTILMAAVRAGDAETVRELMTHGADVNARR